MVREGAGEIMRQKRGPFKPLILSLLNLREKRSVRFTIPSLTAFL